MNRNILFLYVNVNRLFRTVHRNGYYDCNRGILYVNIFSYTIHLPRKRHYSYSHIPFSMINEMNMSIRLFLLYNRFPEHHSLVCEHTSDYVDKWENNNILSCILYSATKQAFDKEHIVVA